MSTPAPPACRHRGEQFAPGHWVCSSPKVVVPGGIVTADVCRHQCPYVDHADDPRFTAPACANPSELGPYPTLPAPVAVAADPGLLAVAMITAPRPVPTAERSLFELRRAGFGQTAHVFEEPGTDLPLRPGVRLFANSHRLGAWGNWRRAAESLLELSDAPFLLVCEDDIRLRPDALLGLVHAVRTLPHADWGYASLYTPWHNVRGRPLVPGWQAIPVGHEGWGALAYCFTRASLEAVLAETRPLENAGDAHTDMVVSSALRQFGRQCYFHVPSLGDHTGEGISSLGHRHLAEMAAVGFQATARDYVPAAADSPAPPPGREAPAPEAASAAPGAGTLSGASVAVIVPTFNCGAYLGDCLRSLLRQTVPCELVVVDDGSTDGTAEVLAEFAGRVRLLRHERNRGANAARNTGLGASASDWVVMADADAVYAPHFLERLLAQATDDVSLVYGPYDLQDARTGERTRVAAQPWDPETLWWSNYVSMCSLVRRRALPARLSAAAAEDALDDWTLWLDLAARGHRGRRVDEVLFTAFLRPEGKTAPLRADPHHLRVEVARHRRAHARLVGLSEPVAVVIPARECLDLTLHCLQHLAWYAGLPVEVAYVDNGSAPHVPAAVAAAGGRLGLVLTVVRNATNGQFTRAVNQGLRLAGGRHVLVLNNDCFIGPDCLERLAWHLTRGPHRVAAVGPLTGDGSSQSLSLPARRSQAGVPAEQALDYQDALACARAVGGAFRCRDELMLAFFCTLLHRDALRECGGLDEATPAYASGLGADDEWCWRVARRGWALKLALDAYAVHLGGQSFHRLGIDRPALARAALAEFLARREE
jgi:GT2 family glycosyltransferase